MAKTEKKTSARSRGSEAPTYRSKSTLNLCMKDRPVLAPEVICLLIVLILLIVLFVEFFGIYRPYLAVERAEAQLKADNAALQETLDRIEDYDEVRQQYRQYNYENFDKTIADRPAILDLVEKVLFPAGKIKNMELNGNTLVLSMVEVPLSEVSEMKEALEASELVEGVELSWTGYDVRDKENKVPTVNFTVTFTGEKGAD